MFAQFRTAIIILAVFMLITGLIYPIAVTGIAQLVFSNKSNGSLIMVDGQIVGSELIGQPFEEPGYFWGRPSATPSFPYNAAASQGSNLAPSNPAFIEAVRARITALRMADPQNLAPIPVDLVTASGSGLDPNISIAAALYQIGRVARARGVSEADLKALVAENTEGRQFGYLGEARVNVLKLNLALDQDYPKKTIGLK